ncbi:hypothetical protein KBA41_07755 [Candidatus Ozemobacteraceae bacterium]|nr:hypothetical protein [Candidatus Ozemobacteraceae bacterium]
MALPRGSTARRWAGAVVAGQWFQICLFQLLAQGHAFRLPVVMGFTGAFAAIVAFVRTRYPRNDSSLANMLRTDVDNLRSRIDQALAGPARRLVLFAAAAAGITMVRGVLNLSISFDSLSYHDLFAGNFVRTGGWFDIDSPGPWGIKYRFYPTAGEGMIAWLILPFHGDLVAGIAAFPAWGLAMAALYELGRSLGLPARRAAIPAVIIGFMPAVFAFLATTYVDIPLLGALLGGLLFFLEAWETRSREACFLCGAAFGNALAIKVFGLAGVTAALGMLFLLCFAPAAMRLNPARWLLAAIPAALAGVPHYLRMYLTHGSPTWPLPLNLPGIPLFPGSAEWATYLARINHAADLMMPGATLPEQIVYLIRWYFGFGPMSFGPACLVLAVVAPAGLAYLWKTGRRGFCAFLLLLLAGSAAGLLGSGMWKFHVSYASINARLISIMTAILALLGILSFERWREEARSRVLSLVLLMGAAAIVIGLPEQFSTGFRAFDLALLGTPFAAALLPVRRLPRLPWSDTAVVSAALVLGCAALSLLAQIEGRMRPRQYAAAYEAHGPDRDIAPAWTLCDDPATPRRIAFSTGWYRDQGYKWYWAPLLGRKLQNDLTYVPITADGSIVEYDDPAAVAAKAGPEAWLRRLSERRIDTLVFFPPFPPEHAWTISRPDLFRPEGSASPALVFRVVEQPGESPPRL